MIITNTPGGGSGGIKEVSTSSEMMSLCTSSNKDKYFKYTGTTGLYTNGDLYQVFEQTLPSKSFADCTWEEINQVCEAGKAADYVTAGTWNIGDINTTVNYGSYTGGIQLVHVLSDTERSSGYYNTKGHIVVQFVNTIATSKYMSSITLQKYFEGTLHTACDTTIYGALDSALKPYLKQWNCIVGKENSTASATTGTYNQTVYLAAPTAKEVGSSNSYNSDENSATFTFSYYSTDATNRRKKSGANSSWWLRSPSNYYGGYYIAYCVNSGGIVNSSYVGSTNGVAPIGCI